MNSLKYFSVYSLTIILFLISNISISISQNILFSNNIKKIRTENNKLRFIYSDKHNNGFTPLAKICTISRPETTSYYKNIIIIKLKEKIDLNDSATCFQDEELCKLFLDLNIKKIRNPYASYFNKQNKDYYNISNIYQIYYGANIDPYTFTQKIKSKKIEYVSPFYYKKTLTIPNDSLFNQQWELRNIGFENIPDTFNFKKTSIIAVVDTEVDWEHEDLAENIWVNPNEIPKNEIDDDGNGKVDDIYGWDFMGNTTYQDYVQGNIFEDNDTKIRDTATKNNHGTLVASCAASVVNNKVGMSSISNNQCQIIAVKVLSDFGVVGDIYEGILYAASMGADVINCSWSSVGDSQYEKDIIKQATAMGSLVIASSGNDHSDLDNYSGYYDNYQTALYVGSIDSLNNPSDFTNYGIGVQTYAPGNLITVALPYNKYTISSGTSLSSPIVMGLAGLVKSIHPDWSPAQIRHQIHGTSDFLYEGVFENQYKYYGKINPVNALIYNYDLKDTLSKPGIEFLEASLNTESGTLNSNQAITLRLNIKNYLADAKELKIDIIPLDTLINPVIGKTISIIRNLEELYVDFDLQLTSAAKWYDNLAQLLVVYKCHNYTSYQLLKIPIEPPPSEFFETDVRFVDSVDNIKINGENIFIKDISSPNINYLWAVGATNQYQPIYILANKDGIIRKGTLFEDTLIHFCDIVEGINKFKAVTVVYDMNRLPSLYSTNDGGLNWNEFNLDIRFQSIIDIRFFNESNGLLIGQTFTKPYIQVRITSDGGSTWHIPSYFPEINQFNSFSKDMIYVLNKQIWIATNDGYLYHSDNMGNNWTKKKLNNIYDFRNIACTNNKDALGLICIDNSFEYGLYSLFSIDSGSTWNVNKEEELTNVIKDYPAYLFSVDRSDIYITSSLNGTQVFSKNKGKNWFPLRLDLDGYLSNSYSFIATMVKDGKKSRIWFLDRLIGYYDLDNLFNPIDTTQEFTNNIAYLVCYPNPANSIIKIQFYLTIDDYVSIKIYNYLSQEIGEIFSDYVESNNYQTVEWQTDYVPTGTYYYVLTTTKGSFTGKFLILK